MRGGGEDLSLRPDQQSSTSVKRAGPSRCRHPASATSTAASQFYEHLLVLPVWEDMTVNDTVQAVQRSGLPTPTNQQHAPHVAAVGGATCAEIGIRQALSRTDGLGTTHGQR